MPLHEYPRVLSPNLGPVSRELPEQRLEARHSPFLNRIANSFDVPDQGAVFNLRVLFVVSGQGLGRSRRVRAPLGNGSPYDDGPLEMGARENLGKFPGEGFDRKAIRPGS